MSPKTIKGMLFVEVSRCLACKSCELACAVAHSQSKTLQGALVEEPRPEARLKVEISDRTPVPLQCRHCEDAPCVAICPTRAIEKLGPNQAVLIREELCIGCKFCVMVCPFGVMSLRRDGKVALKCDLCVDRLEAGEEPACVAGCPSGALKFLEIDEWLKERRRRAAAQLTAADEAAKVSAKS